MSFDLQGRAALVTGGSRGIGRAVAVELARAGATVGLTYASNEAAAKAVAEEIVALGKTAHIYQLDVRDSAATTAVVDRAAADMGGLHVLVASAGIAVDGLVLRLKDAELEDMFRTNVFGAFYAARAAARPMMKARWGRVILLGSVVGEMGNAGQSAYAATKSALDGAARSLARELGSRAITVNVVAPGFIRTDMTARLNEAQEKAITDQIPLGFIADPSDVAQVVRFLASDAARYVTGQVLEVNGGLHM